MECRVLPNFGSNRHAIGPTRHDERDDAVAFDRKLLGGGGMAAGRALVQKEVVGGRISPVFCHEEHDADEGRE